MSKVYAVIEPRVRNRVTGAWESKVDLSPALKYGEITFLLPPGRSPLFMQQLVPTLRERLKDFTANDYLLPIGDPALIAIAAALAADKTNGRLKLLCWDGLNRGYLVSELSLREPLNLGGCDALAG